MKTCCQHTRSPQLSSAPPPQSSACARCCVRASCCPLSTSHQQPLNTKKYNWIHYFLVYDLFRCGFNLSCKRWGRQAILLPWIPSSFPLPGSPVPWAEPRILWGGALLYRGSRLYHYSTPQGCYPHAVQEEVEMCCQIACLAASLMG